MLIQQIQKGESKKLELKEEPNFVSMVFYRKTGGIRRIIFRRTKNY